MYYYYTLTLTYGNTGDYIVDCIYKTDLMISLLLKRPKRVFQVVSFDIYLYTVPTSFTELDTLTRLENSVGRSLDYIRCYLHLTLREDTS